MESSQLSGPSVKAGEQILQQGRGVSQKKREFKT